MEKHERIVSPVERIFMQSPYAIVAMVARIKGNVSESMLKDAVKKAQKRHQNLRVRVQENHDHTLFFTSEEVKDIPIDVISRESDEH
jgi:predicted amino acid-binding ACT domain protein